MSVKVETVSGERVATLENGRGLIAKVMEFGATLLELHAPDRNGEPSDVVLGFDDPARYRQPHPYFGATVGRFANRIANGRFGLDGRVSMLTPNEGRNTLHGGAKGFTWVQWELFRERSRSPSVSFRYTSPAGEEGFPGTLRAEVTYTLSDDDALRIEWSAQTDAPTVVNLTQHAYWNLAGEGDVCSHELQLHASRYLPVDEELLPTGELKDVRGTPMDFLEPRPISVDLGTEDTQIVRAKGGYDHCWVLDNPLRAARLVDPRSGRVMEVSTTQPGIQFYSGNQLDGTTHGKRGVPYRKYAGLCLETQHFPDAPNRPTFPSTLLRPGETYAHSVTYRFSTS